MITVLFMSFSSQCFMHSLAIKTPTLDYLIIHTGIAELFIKANSFNTAFYSDLIIAEFFDPLLGFLDNSAAEVLSAIIGEHNNTSDKYRAVI